MDLRQPRLAPDSAKLNFDIADGTVPKGSASQRFTRVRASANTLSRLSGAVEDGLVLSSFRVEQNGDQLRIIDADGSVYSGSVQKADVTRDEKLAIQSETLKKPVFQSRAVLASPKQAALNERAQTDALNASNAGAASIQVYFFRVTGTNRSANQKVVFIGRLSVPAAAESGAQAADKSASGAAGGEGALPLSQSQVHGEALVGGVKHLEINAAPSGP
jgi:hypothetical protein